jgi:hypothetical protein
MTIPVKGQMFVQVGPAEFDIYDIQYNPTELTFDKQAQLAEIGIPGLDAPIQQFVRGSAEKLTLELFCDTTDQGTGFKATSVTSETDKMSSRATASAMRGTVIGAPVLPESPKAYVNVSRCSAPRACRCAPP